MTVRFALAVLLIAVLAVVSGKVGHAATPWTVEDALDARAQASPRARCIIDVEVGGNRPPYDPYAVGAAGELGIVQLHPQGELQAFYRQGYTDPYNPYQAVEFLEGALRQGRASAWSSVILGMC